MLSNVSLEISGPLADSSSYLDAKAALERSGLKPEDVEEVFFGNVLSAKRVYLDSTGITDH